MAGEFVAGLSWHRLIAASTSSSARDRAMIQVAAQLLITPTREHLVDGLASGCNPEPNRPRAAAALIDGRSGLQTCLI